MKRSVVASRLEMTHSCFEMMMTLLSPADFPFQFSVSVAVAVAVAGNLVEKNMMFAVEIVIVIVVGEYCCIHHRYSTRSSNY